MVDFKTFFFCGEGGGAGIFTHSLMLLPCTNKRKYTSFKELLALSRFAFHCYSSAG